MSFRNFFRRRQLTPWRGRSAGAHPRRRIQRDAGAPGPWVIE
jgi:hypothetical protein